MKKFTTTASIKVPKNLVDTVIGQEEAITLARKAAKQRRNLLLIGQPGTGKSLIGQALAEMLPNEKLVDVLSFPNPNDDNLPFIKAVPKGEGIKIVDRAKTQAESSNKMQGVLFFVLVVVAAIMPWWVRERYGDVMAAASMISSIVFIAAFALFMNLSKRMKVGKLAVPKLIIDNSKNKKSPFLDGTGAQAGALLGDVLHDPLQCLPGEQLVILPNGKPIPIAKLVDPILEEGILELDKKQQFEVLGGTDSLFCYNPTKVLRVFKRKYTGDIIRLKTRRGYELMVTPNHPIAVINSKGNVDYIEAGILSPDSLLVSPYRIPNYVTLKEDVSFLKLLGYILADGYIGGRRVNFKIRRAFKVKEICKVIRKNHFEPKINYYGKNVYISINSASFVRKLMKLGIKEGRDKKIPSFVYDLSPEQIILFLSAYFSLDGYVNQQGQFELFSRDLIPDLAPLLLKLNVRAKIKHRLDPGFGKGNLQSYIIFNHFDFANAYYLLTSNPYHKKNLAIYLSVVSKTHVTFDDEFPVSFEFLEEIRAKTGLSQAKVHKAYYALKPNLKTSQALTRPLLKELIKSFLTVTNGPDLFKLKLLSEGNYASDRLVSIERVSFSGYVYNLTTMTGNFLVNTVLTHNSGGLGTPAYERLVPGLIHRANGGVLFIDEVGNLQQHSQQELLTAMQEKKYTITGQSERSSGAMVRSDPVPTDFVLIAAGNLETVKNMHPALRSRIRGYGYEVYMKEVMDDNEENRDKIVQFIAQEIVKDGKIPHFDKSAVMEIIHEAQKRAGTSGKLTLKLRELGGLIRAAGDLAREKEESVVNRNHVIAAKDYARTLEKQIADRYIEQKKKYQVIKISGLQVGRVNGLAVIGDEHAFSGMVLPIESEVTIGGKKAEFIATGKLGDIAKEAVKNVSAIILKYFGEDLKEKYDVYTQFIGTPEGVEGDSASIAVATSIISALKNIPVRQDTAMTGSLSVRGEVLAVGGVNAKVEAALEAGIKRVIIPKTNENDVLLNGREKDIEVITVSNIREVLKEALEWKGHEKILKSLWKD